MYASARSTHHPVLLGNFFKLQGGDPDYNPGLKGPSGSFVPICHGTIRSPLTQSFLVRMRGWDKGTLRPPIRASKVTWWCIGWFFVHRVFFVRRLWWSKKVVVICSIQSHDCQFFDYVGGKGKSLQGYNKGIETENDMVKLINELSSEVFISIWKDC